MQPAFGLVRNEHLDPPSEKGRIKVALAQIVALQGNQKTLKWNDVNGLMRALGPHGFEHNEPDVSALFNNALPDGVITVSIIAAEPAA